MAHVMKLSAKAIQHLHPGQILVITMDQPFNSIEKQIQWTWPDTFGEEKFVVVMECLHIEMNVMKVKSMQRSGTEAIRTQLQPSKPKREITNITNSQNRKITYGQPGAAISQKVATQQPELN